MRRSVYFLFLLVLLSQFLWAQSSGIQFIFTSDVHYGIARPSFRGMENVNAHEVNAAMVAKINQLAHSSFPADGGIRSVGTVGSVDFVAVGGDIANREETSPESTIQSAAISWSQFKLDFVDGMKVMNRSGQRVPLYVVPGNHDASNAVGHYKSRCIRG
jgi:3',5'-cyclic AMP phosphodiesterase CpdA